MNTPTNSPVREHLQRIFAQRGQDPAVRAYRISKELEDLGDEKGAALWGAHADDLDSA